MRLNQIVIAPESQYMEKSVYWLLFLYTGSTFARKEGAGGSEEKSIER